MKRIAQVVCLAALIVGSTASSARAGDAASDDPQVAVLEAQVSILLQKLMEMQKELAQLRAQAEPVEPQALAWIPLVDVEHFESRLAVAAKERQPVVVFFQASWCSYSKAYRDVIDKDAALRRGFESVVRLTVDVERAPRTDLREAIGVGPGQPILVFFGADGQRIHDVTLDVGYHDKIAQALQRSLEAVTR